MGAHGIEEVPIVGHHNDGALKLQQEVLQPVYRGDIQVVGGLVQQDNVRVAKKGLGQQHLHLLGAGQGGHDRVMELRLDPQPVQQVGGIGLGLPAVHGGELALQLRCLDAVLVGEILLRIDRVLLLHDLIKAGIAHDHRIQHRILVVFKMVLLQEGEPLAWCDGDLPAGGIQLAGQDLQKGRLSRAVGADQAIAVAFRELDVHVLEKGPFAQTQCDVVRTDHIKTSYLLR